MPYDRAADIVRLAIRLQGNWGGLTLDDIQREFEVSRRTAERLRDAVEDVFGPLETVDTGEARRHCRLRTPTLRHLVSLSAEELAELTAAADALDRAGLDERAAMLRRLGDKLRAVLEAAARSGIEPDVQALTEAEGLAMRPGPRPRLDDGLLALLREAITVRHVVAFDYAPRATAPPTRRRVEPFGLIYGNRAFLIGPADGETHLRLWRLARMSAAELTGDAFERDPAFDLDRFSRRVLRDLSGRAGRGGAALRRRRSRGRGRVRLPPRPDRGAERRRLDDRPLHRRRRRRDVLARGHLGNRRHRRATCPPAPAPEPRCAPRSPPTTEPHREHHSPARAPATVPLHAALDRQLLPGRAPQAPPWSSARATTCRPDRPSTTTPTAGTAAAKPNLSEEDVRWASTIGNITGRWTPRSPDLPRNSRTRSPGS